MSDENKPEVAGALMLPERGEVGRDAPQPRQPQSLQGLLRFAMEATRAEDAPGESQLGPMDAERLKFLEEALQSMTVDVIQLLQLAVQKLVACDRLATDAPIEEYVESFETILEHVDRIDTANDFHKIGGFAVFNPCFNCPNYVIRAKACDLLAELCQNNPYCQKAAMDMNLLPMVLSLVDKDPHDQVKIKGLYAISCIVRENLAGFETLKASNGLSVLLHVVERPVDKIRTKATFFLSALCAAYPEMRRELIRLGFVPQLVSLIGQERLPSHEHVMRLLLCLLTTDDDSSRLLQEPSLQAKRLLMTHLRQVELHDDCAEEKELCYELLKMAVRPKLRLTAPPPSPAPPTSPAPPASSAPPLPPPPSRLVPTTSPVPQHYFVGGSCPNSARQSPRQSVRPLQATVHPGGLLEYSTPAYNSLSPSNRSPNVRSPSTRSPQRSQEARLDAQRPPPPHLQNQLLNQQQKTPQNHHQNQQQNHHQNQQQNHQQNNQQNRYSK